MEMGQKEKRGVASNVSRGIVFGMIGTAIIMFLLCIIAAGLIAKEMLPQESMAIISPVICAVGMLVGCRIAIGKSGQGALPVSLGCAAVSLLLLYLCRLILKSDTAFDWQNIGIALGAALAAALLWSGKKRKRR